MVESSGHPTLSFLGQYCHNHDLFKPSYFEAVLRDPNQFPRLWQAPEHVEDRLQALRQLWEGHRDYFLRFDSRRRDVVSHVGLPPGFRPYARPESGIENRFIGPVVKDIFGCDFVQNTTFRLQGDAAEEAEREGTANKRPDMIVFRDAAAIKAASEEMARLPREKASNGALFCRSALLILDAKHFSKGIGADEGDDLKLRKSEREGASKDIHQVDQYLRGYYKPWGVLTNGRSWRLMRQGEVQEHLRFDLVLFLEHLRERPEPTAEDRKVFTLFWNLFGPPAVASGVLDDLQKESTANTREVRDALRDNAHKAVETIARGFWENRQMNDGIPDAPDQPVLDHLRELALTLLYRLLFVLKAEAQNLLPMEDAEGAATPYARNLSTGAIYDALQANIHDRGVVSTCYGRLQDLFHAVSEGHGNLGVAAYNGGLFDASRHPELRKLRLTDEVLVKVFDLLIYLDPESSTPGEEERQRIPYRDLDVRDLGDIYESLLEQRLVLTPPGADRTVELRNQKGERKASGSYFTPDRLVEHVVRKTVDPLLEACGADPVKVLELRVLDPAMGSGHFLVKAVDLMADYLTRQCDPIDLEVPGDNGPGEFAYWKSKVVEHCIYGVDYNPMAVELAKVALWLHCARRYKPLSFLDHHLKVGNSLTGVTVDRLTAPGQTLAQRKSGPVWKPVPPPGPATTPGASAPVETKPKRRGRRRRDHEDQLLLPFNLDMGLVSGIIESVQAILRRPSDRPEDIRAKSTEYAEAVSHRLAAHRLLADLWCAQWLLADPADSDDAAVYLPDGLYDQVRKACGDPDNDARLAELSRLCGGMPGELTEQTPPFLRRMWAARNEGYGPRPMAFFHWQLEFPEVAFSPQGQPKPGFGFDAVIGNPPWDKIKPAKRDYYGPFSSEVAGSQGTSLNRLIARLEANDPALAEGWTRYEKDLKGFAAFLANTGQYEWQTAQVSGRRTGGDPDLFRYFVERASQSVGPGGRFGLVVPGALWQAEGCTGLRRMLLGERTLESLYVFENYRKWAFDIHSSFKFTAFVARAEQPSPGHDFPAAFMLRDSKVLDGLLSERVVRLSRKMVETMSPDTLAFLDFRCDADAQLIARLHREHPALGDPASGWDVKYRREVDMTNDAWLFRYPKWMEERGFTHVRPVRDRDGSWRQEIVDHGYVLPPERRAKLPPGGEYWVAADASYYEESNYESYEVELPEGKTTCFVSREDLTEVERSGDRLTRDHFRIIPGAIYTALYEGRMVHNFDHLQKAYVKGEGRKAVWGDLDWDQKTIRPRLFVTLAEVKETPTCRLGFCDVTGATNERTTLATVLSQSSVAGNKVPTLSSAAPHALHLAAIANSLVFDSLVRLRVSTTMNWVYVRQIPVPASTVSEPDLSEVAQRVARLSCSTPELADYWNSPFPNEPWNYASAERDPWERAKLRAELDAIVADRYGLSVPEYARILTGFPLLDRNWTPLPGDFFVTESDESRVASLPESANFSDGGSNWTYPRWQETESGYVELKPRSFITRDFALLTYIERRRAAGDPEAYVPERLDEWYRDVVGLDPDGPLSRFRIGEVKHLRRRVEAAKSLGAIPYVPSSRASGDNAASEPDGDAPPDA